MMTDTATSAIRKAEGSDLPRILEMAEHFYLQSPYRARFTMNKVMWEESLLNLLSNHNAVIYLALKDEEPVGMVGLTVYINPITSRRTVGEIFLWVEPEHRGRLGIALIRKAEEWAVESQAECLHLSAPTEELRALYERLGYTVLDVNYQKVL
jgi:GNAT superfamily N-acetyltransferase